MNCPYCDVELVWDDYFGKWNGHAIDKRGDIYKCPNDECDSGVFNFFFWNTLKDESLREGYPC